jgi:ketosteroid isomerase-like protein/quercetin dioxygenase-like cupin family protein
MIGVHSPQSQKEDHMHHLKKIAIVAAYLIALAACAPPAADTAADEAALSAGTTAWLQAYNAGDVDRIVAMYAEDGIMMPPNAPAASGRAAMRAYITAGVAEAKAAGVTLVNGENHAGVSGNLGWHSGSYKVTDASGATVDSGNYLETARKTDGKWLILRDIWNSDRPTASAAQDAVKVDPAHYKVLAENAGVRVLRIGYAAGEKSQMHSHPDSMLFVLSGGKVRFTMPDGKTEDDDLPTDSAAYTPAATHNPANMGKTALDAILVELKSAPASMATLPASRPGITLKVLAEGARATAYRATSAATFSEPAGSKHDYDQVVIALGPSQLSLSLDGKPAKTAWARGDVELIPRGVPHEAKNTSGKPVDFVIVAIK